MSSLEASDVSYAKPVPSHSTPGLFHTTSEPSHATQGLSPSESSANKSYDGWALSPIQNISGDIIIRRPQSKRVAAVPFAISGKYCNPNIAERNAPCKHTTWETRANHVDCPSLTFLVHFKHVLCLLGYQRNKTH